MIHVSAETWQSIRQGGAALVIAGHLGLQRGSGR
jgi:hypothetical protein